MTLPVVSISGKKKKKPSLVLTLSGAGLLIGGGIAAYWLLTQGKPLSRDLPVGANIIPQDALFTVSLSTDSSQWEKLRSFGTKESQAALDKNLIQWRDRFLAKDGFDFKKDVSPWVGDQVTIAILAPKAPMTASKPVASDGIATVEQSLVMVLPIKDRNKIQTAFAQPKALKGKWVEREYEGITIKEAQTNSGEKLSTAVIEERFLVIADNPKATERTIEAYIGKATLANSNGFAKHLPKIATYQPLAQFYVNVPSAAQIASITSAKRRLPAQVLAQLKNNQGLAGTVSVESEGLRLKGVSWLKPSSRKVLAVENKATTMTTRLPAETLMMFSGGNLRRTWADYVLTAQKNPLSPVKPEKLRDGFKNITSLDLDRDLLSWMGGEFTVSVVPQIPNKDFPQDVRAALVFMVQASDRLKAEASLKQLDEAMRTQYEFKIKDDKVGEIPVTRWVGPSGTLTATHGWLDGDIAFLTLGAPIADKIIPKPKNILAKAASFQKAVPSELDPTSTQFFLDMEGAAKSLSLPALFPEQQSFLNALNSVGVTTAVTDSRTTRYDILLKLKKGEKPVVLPIPKEKSE